MIRFILLIVVATLSAGCAGSAPPRLDTPTPTAARVSPSTLAQTPTPTRPPSATVTAPPTTTSTPTLTRTPTNTPLPKGRANKIETKYRSSLLNEERVVLIYLPPGYNDSPQRRYPVLYLLHGYGGCDDKITEWETWGLKDKFETLITTGQIQPFILVQPDGFMNDCQPSYFFNHQPGMTDGKPWGDYIWGEVVNLIDKSYRTFARRESRAIGGFSNGGQGALSLSFLHPEVFSIVGAHSPSFRGADGSIAVINDWNWFNQSDPIWLAQNTDQPRQLKIWIDVGKDDDKVRHCGPDSNRCVEEFRAILLAKKIPYEWRGDWAGKHESTYWSAHIPDYLLWYSSQWLGQ